MYAWEHKAGKTEVYNTGDRPAAPSGELKQPEQPYSRADKILIGGFGILCSMGGAILYFVVT